MADAEIEKTIGAQARFLTALGLSKRDIAALLNTTEATVRVELAKLKKSGRSKRGKKKGSKV
jgi:transposase